MTTTVGAIGLDFGSLRTVVGCAKRGGVEILCNEASHRETLNVVGFSNKERFMGEQGYARMKSNFRNTVTYFSRFLAMDYDSQLAQDEKRFIYAPTVSMPNGKLGFRVKCKGEDLDLYPEQVYATMLQKYKGIVQREGIPNYEFVISVPSYFTDMERQAVLTAARIAEVNVIRLMNESSAIALNYGLFRASELTADPRTVLFIDMGNSKTSVSICSFTKERMSIVYEKHERNLGARDMDWILFEFYSDMFSKKYGADPRKNDKARFRLLEAIEKQRKMLSANEEASINVEYLMNDEDLSYSMRRDQLLKLVEPVLTRFRNHLTSAITESKLTLSALHSVEIVGGWSRTPVLQQIIQEAVSGVPVSKTLNASESIARGCATQAAMLSPLFKVKEYEMKEYNTYPIQCKWTFLSEMQEEGKKPATLFPVGCSIPILKSLTFQRKEPIELTLFYDDPVPFNAEKILGKFLIDTPPVEEPEFSHKIMVKLTRDGILQFASAELQQTYYVDEPVPAAPAKMETEKPADASKDASKEAPKPEQPAQPAAGADSKMEVEVTKKKKSKVAKSSFKIDHTLAHSDKEVSNFFELECRLFNEDRIVVETLEIKNALESLLYDLRRKQTDKEGEYITKEEKAKLETLLNQVNDWLFEGAGMDSNKSSYAAKTEELRSASLAWLRRVYEHENLEHRLLALEKVVKEINNQYLTKMADFAHWTDLERQKFLDAVQSSVFYCENNLSKLKSVAKTSSPPTTCADADAKQREFYDAVNQLLNKPKPKPKPEEKKEAEKPAPAAEGEKMKEEGKPDEKSKMEEEAPKA